MITVTCTYANGDTVTTRFNGTPEQAQAYFVGQTFNVGTVEDNMQRCVSITVAPVDYMVDVYHNVTRTEEGRTAIFDRDGDQRAQPGDTLVHVGTLTVQAGSLEGALEAVYEAGNAPFDTPQVREYRTWHVRSLCAGDVVSVTAVDGCELPQPEVFSCEPVGWVQTALGLFTLVVDAKWRCPDHGDACETHAQCAEDHGYVYNYPEK